jgi:lambda family phage portal protein
VKETRSIAAGSLGAIMGLDAGSVGRKEASWTTWPMSADQTVWQFWNILCARSRECANNNDHGRRYMHLVRDNVVGSRGVRLKPIPKGSDGKYDEATADAISDAWTDFLEAPEVTGKHDGITTERLLITSAAMDGEVLAKIVIGDEAGPYGFAIQPLDPFLLDPHHNQDGLPGGNYIRFSIEYNKAGRPVAYHLRKGQNDYWGYASTMDYERVPADQIIHAFVPELVGQRRGLPWMRAALLRLWHIKGYEQAAVINARVSAAKCGFFREPDGEATEEPLEMDAQAGVFEDIGNKEFVKAEWNWPTGEFGPFLAACLRHASASLNVANHSLTGDMSGANYSSLRVASLDEREGWMALQVWFSMSVMRPIYVAWLKFALLADKIVDASGKPLPAQNLERYKRVLWLGRRWGWIDPLKEVSANIQAIMHRLKSRTAVIEEQGGDATQVWEQVQAEEEELEGLGITVPSEQGGQQTPNQVTVGPDANGNDDPDADSDPDSARASALEADVIVMRAAATTNATIIAEREAELARLRATLQRKPKKRAA